MIVQLFKIFFGTTAYGNTKKKYLIMLSDSPERVYDAFDVQVPIGAETVLLRVQGDSGRAARFSWDLKQEQSREVKSLCPFSTEEMNVKTNQP